MTLSASGHRASRSFEQGHELTLKAISFESWNQARGVTIISSEVATRRTFWAIRQSFCSYGFTKPNAMSDKVFCRIRMGVWAKWV